ncbi:hypothetical protein DEO72_LG9g1301 [Vigna unguiculata]|uniref:Uncharacterized protein n=1 Tax=Vigna unguiculata TaxID=3917 RepID=A0A4D6MXQ0_VIGUN|nr:hypothetical protein DEO72_LG9g1301 [Vigna unguiculata]
MAKGLLCHRQGHRFLEWLLWRRKIAKSVWRLNLERVRVCGFGGRLLRRSSTVCVFSFSRVLSQKAYSLRTVTVFLPTGKVLLSPTTATVFVVKGSSDEASPPLFKGHTSTKDRDRVCSRL